GPIALQIVVTPTGTIEPNRVATLIGIVSVPTSGVDDVLARLAPLDGTVAAELDQPDGTVAVVWAGSDVAQDRIDDVIAGMHADPAIDLAVSLDEPRAFAGVDPGWMFLGNPIHEALFADVVGTVELGGDEAVV